MSAIAVFVPHSLATTKGLSQIVTLDLQGPGDLSLSLQIQDKRIANPFSREPIERYHWPLAAGILLITATMFISERRRDREDRKIFNQKSVALAALSLKKG